VVPRGERVDDWDLGLGGELSDRIVRAVADHDRVEVAREHPARVADRLAARKLQFVAAQDYRRRPQLGDADLEGNPRPGRGLLEDEGNAAPGQIAGTRALSATGFELRGEVEQLGELEGPELVAGEEISLRQAADTREMQLTAISWNLFHGRDFPPDPALRTWRSRLLGTSERNATHIQVNRDLLPQFARMLAGAEWDVTLLQECPPRWCGPLARACEAEAHMALTSRNSLAPLRAFAARLNPDLIGAGEGGSNLTLVRNSFRCSLSTYDVDKEHRKGGIVERRERTIHRGRPERRTMAFTRTASGLCIANLHATNDRPHMAVEDVRRAAEAASAWAGDAPLLFGGDLNLRPDECPTAFAELQQRFGLAAPTSPRAIDHLLARGLNTVEPPRQWPPERREVRERGLALRLSDHAPVGARFATADPR
jgi:endonuclease/exonuclease/phosphatase family metal-dependent hydrolase